MKLLLDQGLPRSAARLLREDGIDTLHVGEIGLSTASDNEILRRGREDERVIVTSVIWGGTFFFVAVAVKALPPLTLVFLRVALAVGHPWQLTVPAASVVWAVLGLATISTAFVYIIYFRVLATAGATNILLVTFLIPVSAIFLGTVFLDEQLAGRHFIGMGLIGAGLAAIDGRLFARIGLKKGLSGN